MADIKFSELVSAPEVKGADLFAISQESGGTYTSYKTSVADVADKIATDTIYNELTSDNKKLTGAINEKVGYKENGVLGAKNLLIFPYHETSHTENGVEWTVYPDGTVMAHGKAVGGNSTLIIRTNNQKIKSLAEGNSYILTGCPNGGGLSSYGIRIYFRTSKDTAIVNAYDSGNGVNFSIPLESGYDHDYGFIRVYEGTTVDHLIFKPMIRLASDPDATYRPYTMTNKELTDALNFVPETAGAYTLQATRNADGTITYSWV